MRVSDTEVLMPRTAAEATEAFGDGKDVTVFAGGTILMPEISYGRYPRGGRTLLLAHAGLDQIEGDGRLTVGAMVSLNVLASSGVEPLASAAANIADFEVRAQGTVGGNLCAPPGVESPRGDLQPALLALGAQVRSAGEGGERTEPVDEFLAAGEPRLVLAIEVEQPERAVFISQRRRHAHSYAVMSVASARSGEEVRVAAGGVGSHGARLTAVEQALSEGSSSAEAAARALDGLDPQSDALASAWYRRTVLPTLVTRALEQLEGA